MPGCSLSLLRVDEGRLALLDAATGARAWPGGGRSTRIIHVAAPAVEQGEPGRARRRRPALDRCLKPALGAGGGAARQGADADRAGFAGGRRRPGRQHEARRRRHPGGARRGPGRSGRRAGRAGRACARPSPAVPARSPPVLLRASPAGARRAAVGARLGRRVQRCRAGRQRPGRAPRPATGPCWMRCSRPPPPSSRAWPRARRRLSPSPRRSRPRSRARRRPPPWRARRPRQLWASAPSVPDGGAVAVACWLGGAVAACRRGMSIGSVQ